MSGIYQKSVIVSHDTYIVPSFEANTVGTYNIYGEIKVFGGKSLSDFPELAPFNVLYARQLHAAKKLPSWEKSNQVPIRHHMKLNYLQENKLEIKMITGRKK